MLTKWKEVTRHKSFNTGDQHMAFDYYVILNTLKSVNPDPVCSDK